MHNVFKYTSILYITLLIFHIQAMNYRLPQEIHSHIKFLFKSLVYKDFIACPSPTEWIILKNPIQTFSNRSISDAEILNYYETNDGYSGKILQLHIDKFKIKATIVQPYGHFLNAHIRRHDLEVYDENNTCIIQHSHTKPISFVEMKNNILTIYYNNTDFIERMKSIFTNGSMTADSWILYRKREKLSLNIDQSSSINCFELALLYNLSVYKDFLSKPGN